MRHQALLHACGYSVHPLSALNAAGIDMRWRRDWAQGGSREHRGVIGDFNPLLRDFCWLNAVIRSYAHSVLRVELALLAHMQAHALTFTCMHNQDD